MSERKLLSVAEKYVQSMKEGDFNVLSGCLCEDVTLSGPLENLHGREKVVDMAKRMRHILEDVQVETAYTHDDQAILAAHLKFHEPIGKVDAALVMSFKDDKISKLTLFREGKVEEDRLEAIRAKL